MILQKILEKTVQCGFVYFLKCMFSSNTIDKHYVKNIVNLMIYSENSNLRN